MPIFLLVKDVTSYPVGSLGRERRCQKPIRNYFTVLVGDEKPSQLLITVNVIFFPSIEKPVLQSRHSLDGSKLAEKVETAQPLWITLALQKQKGFREQQVTREERKQAREAKQAEKLSKDTVSSPLRFQRCHPVPSSLLSHGIYFKDANWRGCLERAVKGVN